MKKVHAATRPCMRAGSLLLAATMLAGCGFIGGGDRQADEGKQEEGRLAQALRMIGEVKDVMAGKESTPDADAQDADTAGNGSMPEMLGRMLEGMASAAAAAAGPDDDTGGAEGVAQEGNGLNEIMQRIQGSGDLSQVSEMMSQMMQQGSGDMSQAGDMMSQVMQMMGAMGGMQAPASGAQAAAAQEADATQVVPSEQMRELGGIPVISKLTREQELALFAPQAWEDLP